MQCNAVVVRAFRFHVLASSQAIVIDRDKLDFGG
jgi:hypothetical protein